MINKLQILDQSLDMLDEVNNCKFASEKLLMKTVESLETSLLPYRNKLLEHPLYNKLKTEESIKVFMSYHSFAVWDFMSLVKSLQLKLTSTQIPWTPVGNPSTRRLINEIVWRTQPEAIWVNFKVWGILPITFIFTVFQLPLIRRYKI